VQPSHGLRFPVDERTAPRLTRFTPALQQGFDESGRKRARSAFDGDLRHRRKRKLSAQSGEEAQQLRGASGSRGSTAEVDRVGGVITRRSGRRSERASHLRRKLARVGDIFEHAGNVFS